MTLGRTSPRGIASGIGGQGRGTARPSGSTAPPATASTGVGPRRGRAGVSPTPITYENDCRACHPLGYDPDRPALTIRHGLQPAEVHRRSGETSPIDSSRGTRPGIKARPRSPDPRPRTVALTRRPGRRSRGRSPRRNGSCSARRGAASVTLRRLPTGRSTGPDPPGRRGRTSGSPPRTSLRSGWATPRSTTPRTGWWIARSAMPGRIPTARSPRVTSGDVLLPEIGKCRSATPPRRSRGRQGVGGADFRCIECHRYHGGDARHGGAGPLVRDAAIESSLGRFLLGAQETR